MKVEELKKREENTFSELEAGDTFRFVDNKDIECPKTASVFIATDIGTAVRLADGWYYGEVEGCEKVYRVGGMFYESGA